MANIILVPKRKLITAKSEPGVTNVTNTSTTSITVGGNYLLISGGTMTGELNAPVRLKIPVGSSMYG
jgi:hypothetical protein